MLLASLVLLYRMSRLVGGDRQQLQVNLPTNNVAVDKMSTRCNNCPSRKCPKCPMFGVGEEFEQEERIRLIAEDVRSGEDL